MTQAARVMSFYSHFAEYYEQVFPFREEVYAFLRTHVGTSAQHILDVGCGTGHYCGRFTADGFRTVGVDLDAAMIEFARRRYPQASFRMLDMRALRELHMTFDAAFCIGNVAAHLTANQFRSFLESLRDVLRLGGYWIFQVVNWDYILAQERYVFPARDIGSGSGRFFREYVDISEDGLRFRTRLESGGAQIFEDDVWLYPIRVSGYDRVHRQLGFEQIGHFADYRGAVFNPSADSASIFVFKRGV